MPGASKTITINAPLEKVFGIITDYERYPEFLPEVKKVRLSDRKPGEVQVHYEVNVIKTIKYSLKMREEPPGKVTWSFVQGEFMKDNQGSWTLEADGAGKTKATYQVEMALGALVPKTITNALVETSLPKMLDAFKQRAESGA